MAKHTRSFCLFATHFRELTTLKEMVPYVENLHVAAHVGSSGYVTLLYKVNKGVGDKSFGIHVAELANLPPQVMALAKHEAIKLDQIEFKSILNKMLQRLIQDEDVDDIKNEYLPKLKRTLI